MSRSRPPKCPNGRQRCICRDRVGSGRRKREAVVGSYERMLAALAEPDRMGCDHRLFDPDCVSCPLPEDPR